MKDNPKISVIMPSLNVGDFIEECIESVINQTFKDLEIICVDAGSTDGTLEILKKYSEKDSRVTIINSDVKSYGHQMNLGIAASKGEYIGIVETDDYIDEKMYETLYNLTNNGSTDISKVNFYHLYVDDPENIRARADDTKKNLPEDEFTVYDDANILNGHPCIWAAIYRKKFLEENNISFIEAPGGGWVDNPFLFETLLLAESVTYKDEPFYYYHELNPTSSTNNIKDVTLPMRRMINVLDLLDKYSCTDKDILAAFYVRVFHHVNETLEKYDIENEEEIVYNYFSKVLRRLNEDIVNDRFKLRDKKYYYKYRSPLTLIKDEEFNKNEITKEDLEFILAENNFLYARYNELKKNNKILKTKYNKLKRENKKLTSQNKKSKKKIKDIKKSKSFKLGSKIAMPVRKVKKINKQTPKKNRILYIFSNNDKTSETFVSEVNLIYDLINKYNIDAFTILPYKGDGVKLLDSMHIKYEYIKSINWVTPLLEIKYLDEINEKEQLNEKSIKEIRKFIKKNKINLIHINNSYSYVGARAAISEKIPFIWHLRESLEEDHKNTLWDRTYGNKLINKADKIITTSHFIYKKYEKVIDKEKLIHISPNVDNEIELIYKEYCNILKK